MTGHLPLAGVADVSDEDRLVVVDGDVEVVGTDADAAAVQDAVDHRVLLDGRKPIGGDRLEAHMRTTSRLFSG